MFFSLILLITLVSNVSAFFGFSLNYPGIGLKITSFKQSLELRFQITTGEYRTSLLGIRYYNNILRKEFLNCYLGGELGGFLTISENYDAVYNAFGFVLGGFAGIEKFLKEKISVFFDIGPYWALASSENVTVDEFDFVLNLGINFYFGK